MIFDWTISLGNILTVGGFAASGIIFVMMMRADLRVLAQRVTAVESALKDVAAAALASARTEARVETLDERLNMISHRLDDHISRVAKAS